MISVNDRLPSNAEDFEMVHGLYQNDDNTTPKLTSTSQNQNLFNTFISPQNKNVVRLTALFLLVISAGFLLIRSTQHVGVSKHTTNHLMKSSEGLSHYDTIVSEQCSQLQDSSNLFAFLLPCGEYQSNEIEMRCLSPEECEDAIRGTIPTWELVTDELTGNSITKKFEFPDFQHAFLFMTQAAQLAEKNQHHPDWRNLYNTVEVILTTDDQMCLSTYDIHLAKGMDYLYNMQLDSAVERR